MKGEARATMMKNKRSLLYKNSNKSSKKPKRKRNPLKNGRRWSRNWRERPKNKHGQLRRAFVMTEASSVVVICLGRWRLIMTGAMSLSRGWGNVSKIEISKERELIKLSSNWGIQVVIINRGTILRMIRKCEVWRWQYKRRGIELMLLNKDVELWNRINLGINLGITETYLIYNFEI